MKIAIVILVLGIMAALVLVKGITPQKRGLGGVAHDMLASNGRPALAVHAEGGLRLVDAGWCSVQVPSHVSLEGDARVWYARYAQGDASLVVVLAETNDPWRWDFGNSTVYKMFNEREREYKDQTLYEATYVLPVSKDPFSLTRQQNITDRVDGGDTLVRRTKLMREFYKVQVLVEYREPLPRREGGKIPAVDDAAYLAAFAKRALESFTINMRATGDNLPESIVTLEKAPKELSRRSVGAWLGSVRRDSRD